MSQHASWKEWFRFLLICRKFSISSYTVKDNRSKLEKLENCQKVGSSILDMTLFEMNVEKQDAGMRQTQASYHNGSTKWHVTSNIIELPIKTD